MLTPLELWIQTPLWQNCCLLKFEFIHRKWEMKTEAEGSRNEAMRQKVIICGIVLQNKNKWYKKNTFKTRHALQRLQTSAKASRPPFYYKQLHNWNNIPFCTILVQLTTEWRWKPNTCNKIFQRVGSLLLHCEITYVYKNKIGIWYGFVLELTTHKQTFFKTYQFWWRQWGGERS